MRPQRGRPCEEGDAAPQLRRLFFAFRRSSLVRLQPQHTMKIALLGWESSSRQLAAEQLAQMGHVVHQWETAEAFRQSALLVDAVVLTSEGPPGWRENRDRLLVMYPVLSIIRESDLAPEITWGLPTRDGFLVTPYFLAEFTARANLLAGSSWSDDRQVVLRVGRYSFDVHGSRAYVGERPVHLTPPQYDVAFKLFSIPNRLVPYDALRSKRSRSPHPSRTLDVTVSNLRKALAIGDRDDMSIVAVRGLGYMLVQRKIGARTSSR